MSVRKLLVPLVLLALLAVGSSIGPLVQVEAQVGETPLFALFDVASTPTQLSTVLGTTQVAKKITVKNSAGANDYAYVGNDLVENTPNNAGIELVAGEAYTFTATSPARIYVVGTGEDSANVIFVVAEY